MFPLVWSIVREYRLRRLSEPLQWIRPTQLPRDVQPLADVLEESLSREAVLGDYTSWVLEDLPSGQAHLIDADTDLIWSFLLLLAIKSPVPAGSTALIIGPSTFARRDRIESVFGELRGRAAEIELDFAVPAFADRVLPLLEQMMSEAFRAYRSEELNAIRVANLSDERLAQVATGVFDEWSSTFPRSLLHQLGLIKTKRAPRSLRRRFAVAATAPKLFLIDDTRAIGESAQMIGRDLGRALGRGESLALVKELRRTKTYEDGRTPGDRVEGAIQILTEHGSRPTHCLVPYFWRSSDALRDLGITSREEVTAGASTIKNLLVSEWIDWDADSILVLDLSRAIQWIQYVDDDSAPTLGLHLTVNEVSGESTKDVGQDGDEEVEPQVYIEAFEQFRLSVSRELALRIPLGSSA